MILTECHMDRIIELAWKDRTPFEAIKFQYELKEQDIIKLMQNTFVCPLVALKMNLQRRFHHIMVENLAHQKKLLNYKII